MASRIGDLLIGIGSDISGLTKGLAQAERKLNQTAKRFQDMGQQMTMAVTLPLAGIGAAAIKSFADFEKLGNALTAVMGSSEAARMEMERLEVVAKNPGINFEQAVKGSARLQAVGFSAAEARDTLTQFANAVARSGGGAEELDGVTLALGQIASKGKVFAEEINQINERVYEIRPAMEAAFGTANSEELQKMGITAEEFISKVTAELGKLERVDGGLANAMENIAATSKKALADVGQSINELFNVQGIIESLAAWIERAAEKWGNLGDVQKKIIVMFAAVAAAIGPVLLGIGAMAKAMAFAQGVKLMLVATTGKYITALGNSLKSMAAFRAAMLGVAKSMLIVVAKVAIVVAAIAALALVANYVKQNWEPIKVFFSNLWADIANGFNRFIRGFLSTIDWVVDKASFGKVQTALAEGFSFKEIEKQAIPQMMGFVEATKAGMAQVKDWWTKNTSSIGKTSDAIELATETMQQFEQASASASAKLSEMPGKVSAFSGLKTIAPGSLSGGGDISGMAKPMDELLVKLDQARTKTMSWRDVFAKTVDGITSGMQRAYEGIEGALGAVDSLFGQLFANRQAGIDATYEAERKRIEESKMNDEAKQKALQKLEEQTDAKRRKLARQQAIREKILGIIQATIATAVNVTRSLANPIMAAIIAAAGAAQIALIAGQKIPALAKGGLAYAPTMAMVGDNPGAKVDPEVIAPLSKLEGMFGRGVQEVVVRGVISGRDLLLVQERAQQDRLRTRGF